MWMYEHREAVRTMSRAQWFLMSLPMIFQISQNSLKNSADVESKNGLKVVKDRNEARYPSLRTGRTKSEKRIEEGLSI
jgi:cell division protein FtsB